MTESIGTFGADAAGLAGIGTFGADAAGLAGIGTFGCRGEPVQQIRSHTGPRSRRAGSVHVPRFRLLLPDSRGCRQGRRARTDVLTERSWGRSPGAQPAPIPRDRPRLGGGPFHVATGVPFLVAISSRGLDASLRQRELFGVAEYPVQRAGQAERLSMPVDGSGELGGVDG